MANASLTMSAEVHHAFTLSAEWLDNAYLIREQVTDLHESLPQKHYGELPLIASGPEAGLPRIYHVASEMVAESGGALEPEIIRKFLVAFQATAPLDIGELWALPLMLRLQLLERLRAVAILVEQQQSQSEEADFWANRLITAVRHGSPRLLREMEELVERYPDPTPHFASELVAHLYDEEAALPMVSSWLERSLRAPLLEVIQQEHRRQAVQQTALANVINSCRRLAHVQWQELFQSISWAEKSWRPIPRESMTASILRPAIDAALRWKKSPTGQNVQNSKRSTRRCPGESRGGRSRSACRLLFDRRDRPALERGRTPEFRSRNHLADGFARTRRCISEAFPCSLSRWWQRLFFSWPGRFIGCHTRSSHSCCSCPRASGGAGRELFRDLAPLAAGLAKMSFKKTGIPDDCRTLVVVPTLLTTPAAIQNELNRLEIRYLGNTDENSRFSLVTDFADAPRESMPEDAEYIDIVARGIEELNRRHGAVTLLSFSSRTHLERERTTLDWLGAKRGKLEQLNRFLIGESAPELEGFLCAGDRAQLEGIRFVITLDAAIEEVATAHRDGGDVEVEIAVPGRRGARRQDAQRATRHCRRPVDPRHHRHRRALFLLGLDPLDP